MLCQVLNGHLPSVTKVTSSGGGGGAVVVSGSNVVSEEGSGISGDFNYFAILSCHDMDCV